MGLLLSTQQGAGILTLPSCGPIQLGLASPFRLLAKTNADAGGNISFTLTPPATTAGKTFFFQLAEPATCRTSNVVRATF